jgi:hypothetical protein
MKNPETLTPTTSQSFSNSLKQLPRCQFYTEKIEDYYYSAASKLSIVPSLGPHSCTKKLPLNTAFRRNRFSQPSTD